MLVAVDLDERAAIPAREERVAVDREVDLGEAKLVGQRKRGLEDLCASDDEDTLLVGEDLERVLERLRPFGAVGAPVGIPCDDDVPAPGQRAEPIRDRIPRSPTHRDRVADRHLSEVRQVLGQAPRKSAFPTDHAAARDGRDEADLQTATGARIAGWC